MMAIFPASSPVRVRHLNRSQLKALALCSNHPWRLKVDSAISWPNDPAISRQLRWTNRNHSSCSEYIKCTSVTSTFQAEQGSAAQLLPPPWPLNINQTTRREHPWSLSTSPEGVCKWGPWPKSNSRACSLIANYRPRHPNQRPFKGMISDSFLQSSEKYERARRRCKCLDLWCILNVSGVVSSKHWQSGFPVNKMMAIIKDTGSGHAIN